ncbi:carbamoyltransferase HypF [Antrihabitans stalactiti]|uniref:Carbamoyltransferase n=1 Tax=Antrihabitans stalactiti TaxID=2584121 RepID=A0A848KL40_9NOCA|nr:carbamoyltransferase HypF [Antrihabitans stalactiti]NMN99395.1 carbamoyltransferase HypF [Antrihabitans stalactiti]
MSTQVDPESVVGTTVQRRRMIVRGIVQGVGFRPFVAKLARDLGLSGHCGNDDYCVFIEIEGPSATIAAFATRLRTDAPPLSVIVDIHTDIVAAQGDTSFDIVDSRHRADARTLISPDVATCADCVREFNDPTDRRYLHPFINCTNCGPRFTVITDLPYDRPATTMAPFPMCAQCLIEYHMPSNRRYHAQPISCHACGPRIYFEQAGRQEFGDDVVMRRVHDALDAGRIVAVKGLGGFHLVCDAANSAAVARLRSRKRRPDKPFALMAADLGVVGAICEVSDIDERLLAGAAHPIVLMKRRSTTLVATEVAPGVDEFGVMLPYTPLHHLLFRGGPRLLVMTSGNASDEPLCFDNDDARQRLGAIADAFLLHDRKIAVPCEDSVLTVTDGAVLPIRRSRGYAPLPVLLPEPGPVVLAVGAEVKNTFCLTRENYAFCSAHLGDMGSLESQRAFESSVAQLTTLHRVTPQLLVADDHPGYSTRHWAQRHSDASGIELRTVQHHHAHVASLLAEHGRLGTKVLGIAFDGTGYGCDRTVWGGELLEVGPDVRDAVRVGHLQPFWLPGGDAAVRNPARVAAALLHEAGLIDIDDLPCTAALEPVERRLVASQLREGTACARTTSVGRLFDGVSSLLGVCHRASYEAQAAVELEALARTAGSAAPLRMTIEGNEIRFDSLLADVIGEMREGRPIAELALGFHYALADATAELVRRHDVSTVGLTGGVFQNRLLLRLLRKNLQDSGFEVLTHEKVPPNDGGLSLGQAVIGRAIAREMGAIT